MDYYDKAVAYLMDNFDRDIIWDAWSDHGEGRNHPCHGLFRYATPDGTDDQRCPSGKECGCLTQIVSSKGRLSAWTDDLTDAILQDERLPVGPHLVERGHLQIFASWQRRIDAALGRTPPVWTPPEPAQ